MEVSKNRYQLLKWGRIEKILGIKQERLTVITSTLLMNHNILIFKKIEEKNDRIRQLIFLLF